MKKLILLIIIIFILTELGIAQYSNYQWYPTNNFPSPGSTQIYCLAKDPFAWGDLIVGGYTSSVPSPLFTSGNGGTNWTNEGCFSPSMGIYSVAPELSARGTKYLAIRHPTNTSVNGLYRKHNTHGCQLRSCQGLDVRAVTQKFGTVLGGVRGTGRGIYRSTNDGDTFIQIYSGADIYCFEAIILSGTNTMFAGGNYTSGAGILLKSAGYPFNTWTEVAYVTGYVIGITVTSTGNIFIATHQGNIYRSISGGSFEICKTGVAWDELKIPLTSNSSGHIFYGDWQTGMWYSTNNGTNWTQNNLGLPNNHVVDLVVLSTSNVLYGALGGSLSSHIYKFDSLFSNVNIISSNKPENYFLLQNYPNPFNPVTNIKFDLPKTSETTLIIYNALGREVAILVNEKLSAGSYQVDWDGSGYTSGVYFFRLETDGFVDVKKMVLIK